MTRARLADIMAHTGVSRTLLWMRRWIAAPWLPVLTYHRILPGRPGELHAGVDATTEQFERQVALLATHFRFVDTADLIGFFAGRPLPPNPVMITFDDGYRECHSQVLPILLRYGAKATFFVTGVDSILITRPEFLLAAA